MGELRLLWPPKSSFFTDSPKPGYSTRLEELLGDSGIPRSFGDGIALLTPFNVAPTTLLDVQDDVGVDGCVCASAFLGVVGVAIPKLLSHFLAVLDLLLKFDWGMSKHKSVFLGERAGGISVVLPRDFERRLLIF